MGIDLIGMCLIDMRLIGVCLTGVRLMGMCLAGVNLTGVHLAGCVSHGRVPYRRHLIGAYLMGVYL
jgi:uncharacterized protein YjbI with pentapeptide repeats